MFLHGRLGQLDSDADLLGSNGTLLAVACSNKSVVSAVPHGGFLCYSGDHRLLKSRAGGCAGPAPIGGQRLMLAGATMAPAPPVLPAVNVHTVDGLRTPLHVPVLAVIQDHMGEREARTHHREVVSLLRYSHTVEDSHAALHVPVLAVMQDLVGGHDAGHRRLRRRQRHRLLTVTATSDDATTTTTLTTTATGDVQYAPANNDQQLRTVPYFRVNSDRELQTFPPCALSREHQGCTRDDDRPTPETLSVNSPTVAEAFPDVWHEKLVDAPEVAAHGSPLRAPLSTVRLTADSSSPCDTCEQGSEDAPGVTAHGSLPQAPSHCAGF